MKHVSKIDDQVYEISKSVSVFDGRAYEDDITIIWHDKPYNDDVYYDEDSDARVLIGWYWGDYDAELTDSHIKAYWRGGLNEIYS